MGHSRAAPRALLLLYLALFNALPLPCPSLCLHLETLQSLEVVLVFFFKQVSEDVERFVCSSRDCRDC